MCAHRLSVAYKESMVVLHRAVYIAYSVCIVSPVPPTAIGTILGCILSPNG